MYMMLAGGLPPFYGESAVEIFDAVARANLRFPPRVFRSVSPAAKDLMRRILCKDVSRRFSAEQVLRHRWITSRGMMRPVEGDPSLSMSRHEASVLGFCSG
ncbi:hypothetical protein OPV22_027596 [Ensete ventricosum]|uniref:Protein kinase domain-containing protein n=1 Tax=Ensete ventricosum TaxID=4639 RepID=A0AAV8Q0K6_ENSVE|nr:hypothetical protein OPV22_027596 [Ensete ventricosum]